MENYPKVLILVQPFNNNSGGGITLSNLFKGWSKEQLAVACRGYEINGDTLFDTCDRYYQLGQMEQKWIFPFNLFNRKYFSGELRAAEASGDKIVIKKSKFRTKFLKNTLQPFLKWLGVSYAVSSLHLSPKFKRWLDEYEPDIIYAQAQGRQTVLFCLEVLDYLKKPMVFHMMDDWPELIKKESLLGQYWYQKVDGEFKKLLNKCSLHFSISEPMAEEYQIRYGHQWQTFHNPIEIGFWSSHQRNSYNLPEQPSILYAGRLGLGIESSIKMMAKAIDALNKELDLDLKFILQVAESPDWVSNFSCVTTRSFVPYQDLPMRFSEADILFLPYDFTEASLAFIRYSMPTKASEYMISGTPVLIFAPEDTAIVSYANKYNWAKVVTKNDMNVLKDSLKELLMDQALREKIAQNSVYIANQRHNAERVRTEFRDKINEIAVLA